MLAVNTSIKSSKKVSARRPARSGAFWIWVPVFYGVSADLTANIYLPLTTGQLGFPGPIFLSTMMAFFISWPMTVPASIVTDLIKGNRAHVLAVAAAVYGATLGSLFVFWGPSPTLSRTDLAVVFLLGPAVLLALVGWLRGRSADAANPSASPTP